MSSGRLRCLAIATVVLVPANVWAQDDGVDVQQFRPAIGPSDVLGVEAATVPERLAWRAGAFVHSALDPVSARGGGESRVVLERQSTLDLALAIGLGAGVQLSAALPLVLEQRGDATSGAGLGDARAAAKLRVFDRGAARAAVAVGIAAPVGSSAELHSHGSPTVHPRLLADYREGNARIAVDLGVRVRARHRMAQLERGSELTWGVGVAMPLTDHVGGLASLSGAVGVQPGARDTPVELVVAAELALGGDVAMVVGAGTGLSRGSGAPRLRGVLGVRYGIGASAPPGCALGPEDYDGFADGDHCADPDNDADGIADVVDRCPMVAETINGVDDDDGCPDHAARPEPAPPADVPPRDGDGDGVADRDDRCADQAEDIDGFEDEDGCPDLDNDGDGVADTDDRCPSEPETRNRFLDDDGCPDQMIQLGGEQRIQFDSGRATLRPESLPALDEIVATLAQHPEISKIRVDGHTDDRGSAEANRALSQRRAQVVVVYLMKKGVSARRLAARGFGDARPLADNDSREAREHNRRVEFTVLEINGVPVPLERP